MKHHFKPDVELVSSLKKRESLYRKAFLRRCYDLQKAETEVVETLNCVYFLSPKTFVIFLTVLSSAFLLYGRNPGGFAG